MRASVDKRDHSIWGVGKHCRRDPGDKDVGSGHVVGAQDKTGRGKA